MTETHSFMLINTPFPPCDCFGRSPGGDRAAAAARKNAARQGLVLRWRELTRRVFRAASRRRREAAGRRPGLSRPLKAVAAIKAAHPKTHCNKKSPMSERQQRRQRTDIGVLFYKKFLVQYLNCKIKKASHLIKCVGVHSSASGRPKRSLPSAMLFIKNDIFLAKARIVCIPSASKFASPFSLP